MVWLIDKVLQLLIFAIVARAILSFVVPMMGPRPHPLVMSITWAINQVTEPLLGPLRRALPNVGMFDFSPMVAIVVLVIIRAVFVRSVG